MRGIQTTPYFSYDIIIFADVSIFADDVIKKPSKYDKNLRYDIWPTTIGMKVITAFKNRTSAIFCADILMMSALFRQK